MGTTCAALLAAVPLVLAGLWGAGHATHVVELTTGAAWLASPARGLVSLVDGPSAQVAVTLRLPAADPATTVVQGQDTAYVVRAGTLARLDPATWTVGQAVAFADADAPLTVVPGAGREQAPAPLWVLDGRTVRAVDARTLEVRATVDLRLTGRVQAVVDEQGDLWAADDERAVRVRQVHGGLRVAPAGDADGELVLVQGRAVLVDVHGGTVRPLDGERRAACPGTSPGTDVRVVGSATSPEVLTAVGGTLRVAATDDGTCGTVARLGDARTELGTLALVGRYVVAPDLGTGVTSVLDLAGGSPQTFALTPAGHRVELVVRGSTVFWNDLDGHGSGVLELRGDTWRSTPVDKYDPATGAGTQVRRAGDAGGGSVTGAPAPFRVAALVPDRALYAPGRSAVVTPEVTGPTTEDEVWRWRIEDLLTGAVTERVDDTPGRSLALTELPGVGELAVTLVVTRDGATATGTTTLRTVEWCPITVSTTQVDLATDPTVEVRVDPACPVQQQIAVSTDAWLTAVTSGTFDPGSPGVVTLTAVGPPPAAGPVAGALRLEVQGQPGSQVRVDVVGLAP